MFSFRVTFVMLILIVPRRDDDDDDDYVDEEDEDEEETHSCPHGHTHAHLHMCSHGHTHAHTWTHTYTQCMMPELGVGPGSEIPGGVKYKDIRKVYPKEEKGDCGARFLLALEKAFHDLGHEDLLRVVQQGHGDVVRVPVGWYHMVLNHHPKLAIAIECLPLDTLEVVADNYLNAARQFGPYGAEDYVGLASQLWSMLEPIFEAAADEEPGALPLQQAKDVDAAMEGAKKKVEQGGEKQRKRNRVDQGGEE